MRDVSLIFHLIFLDPHRYIPLSSKILALIMVIIFLFTHSGYATLQKSEHIGTDQYSQWEKERDKEEKEWLTVVLIILGVALLIGATVSASSGGGGFSLGINN